MALVVKTRPAYMNNMINPIIKLTSKNTFGLFNFLNIGILLKIIFNGVNNDKTNIIPVMIAPSMKLTIMLINQFISSFVSGVIIVGVLGVVGGVPDVAQ